MHGTNMEMFMNIYFRIAVSILREISLREYENLFSDCSKYTARDISQIIRKFIFVL